MTIFLALVEGLLLHLNGFLGGLVLIPLSSIGAVAGIMARSMANRQMVRERLWAWVRHKFDTWEDFQEWIASTPGYMVEQACKFDDDKWVPNKTGGYSQK